MRVELQLILPVSIPANVFCTRMLYHFCKLMVKTYFKYVTN